MLKGFVVYRDYGRSSRRYFREFEDRIPSGTTKGEKAMIFCTERMASNIAKRCKEYDGYIWKVADLSKEAFHVKRGVKKYA